MNECDEVASNLPLINIGRAISHSEACDIVRQWMRGESETIVAEVAESWRLRVNAALHPDT